MDESISPAAATSDAEPRTAPPADPRPAALRFAELVLDQGSFTSWDTPPRHPRSGPYADALARARARSGADEAALTGEGTIAGRRVAVLLSEFTFLAGSIGNATATRLLGAIERATAERLPLLAFPASGGTRMQEGTPAFVRMVAIANAVTAHKAAGLPYLVHLRHPTTGGVLASWGSLGQLTTAEPGALVGFLGPRVYEALYGEPFPEGVQRAEHLRLHGTVDAVLPPDRLHRRLADILDVLDARPGGVLPPAADPTNTPANTAANTPAEQDIWQSVQLTRQPGRPGLVELLAEADTVVPLSGTGAGERDDALRLSLARFGAVDGAGGIGCVVVGHDRAAAALHGPIGPAGLRTARRGMRLAAELGLPLLTVIDTHGAELSVHAEERALAGEIARCLAELSTLDAPVVSLLLGEGTGGAALALLPADRTVATEHAWLSPLPPEGASVILHRTPDRAPELAVQQRIGAAELHREGVVDRVLPEPVPGSEDPDGFVRRIVSALSEELATAAAGDYPAARLERFRRLALEQTEQTE
ncbi:acetyl-CoA carboxylase beta subunit [Kitasatospora sp. MAP12-15]|uniref:carboxyl transferase domain-containing protein n=1 Tax=unclassified Kitasatospora TaxID=2633591 RepID=UPI002474CD91|nr:carboxyl transferase domain-containing protein [Kitasatospora sp. MAP12-44]MDH6113847.1 acetyl-CoA carboxylase beta subunit [Kitasatospora sp. MAP12-44]